MKKLYRLNWLSYIKILVPAALLILVIVEARRFSDDVDVNLLQMHLQELKFFKLASLTALGFVAVTPMILYDFVFAKRLGLKIPKRKLGLNSYVFNSYANFIGFGGVAGAALRTYFYQRYNLEKSTILKGIAKLSLFYLSGLSILCWGILLHFVDSSLLETYKWLSIAIWGIALFLPVVLISFLFTKQFDFKTSKDRIYTFQLILISSVEWFLAFMTIYGISLLMGTHIAILDFLPIFIIASSAGVVSMIPGGLGSFDFIVLIGLEKLGVPKEEILLMILLYRFSYFIFPFIVSSLFLFRQFWKSFNRKWTNLPRLVLANVSHILLTALVFIAGLILLVSASVPGIFERLKFMEKILSVPIMNLSHQLSIAAGLTLLGLSRGIEYRVKRAYHLTIGVLIGGSVFTFSKGFDYEEAIFVLLVAWALWIARHRFYREDFVHTWGKFLTDFFVIILMVGTYFFIGYVNLPDSVIRIPENIHALILIDPIELFQSGMIGLVLAVSFLVLGFMIRMPSFRPDASFDYSKLKNHLETYGGNVLSHLIFLKDKYIFWSEQHDVLFSYQTFADKIIVLGNPVGKKDSIHKAMEQLREEADQFGYTPIYYQVSKEMLPYLHENGYDFFKLGEEGYVNLNNFTLSGKENKSLRAMRNKMDRENFVFQVYQAPYESQFFNELKEVSDNWLDGRKEKGFSLGFFDEEYISLSPVAVTRNVEGKVVAFTTLMPVYDGGQTLSVDLMRYSDDAPSGVMDYMFINLFEWAREEGYQKFNLGMAPLSNVGVSKYAFLGEKIASQFYSQGHSFYHFQGVRRFKGKYADEWEPKYLAYKKKSSLLFTMIQLTLLISKRIK